MASPLETAVARRIFIIGPYPPPLNGQSNYNVAVTPLLGRFGEVEVLTTGDTLAQKLRCYAAIAWRARTFRHGDIVYTSPPGNRAKWLFAPLVGVLRLRGIVHYLHHHSYRPIAAAPDRAMQVIVAFGGRFQRHILLCGCMRDRFGEIYLAGDREKSFVLSNAYLFFHAGARMPRPARPETIGHLSVLTREKGVGHLIDSFRRLAQRRPALRLIVAGPCKDEALLAELHGLCSDFPDRVEYRGFVAGEAKARFFEDIDVLVLPTRLTDEAEPLVMLEAFSVGVDVVATGRGCIPERVIDAARLCDPVDETMDGSIIGALDSGSADWDRARDRCRAHVEQLYANSVGEAVVLLSTIFGLSGEQTRDRLGDDAASARTMP